MHAVHARINASEMQRSSPGLQVQRERERERERAPDKRSGGIARTENASSRTFDPIFNA